MIQLQSSFSSQTLASTAGSNPDTTEDEPQAETPWTDADHNEFDFAGTTANFPQAGSAEYEESSEWNTSSSESGLDSALSVRERPVSGVGAPFAFEEDADFEVIEELARGGLGIIYLARQTSLDRVLAIKTLNLPNADEWSDRCTRISRLQRECFLSEALVTANLVHPGIVPIHDLCQTSDGIPFYTMPRLRGVPWVSPAGPAGRSVADISSDLIRTMGLEKNVEVLLKVCDAVAYAHSHGVVNRDLKPENVIIGDFGEVIVLDWGLAVFTPDSGRQNPESSTVSFGAGTPGYMAPELWNGPGEAIGRWSDIYLLGGILFEILTGHAPHKFEIPKNMPKNLTLEERQQMKIDQINDVVGNNRIRETDVQGELMEIALKAMETDPANRYASVQEFQAAIHEYQHHEESRHLTDRADQLMEGATHAARGGYQDFQRAAVLYEEALRKWPQNRRALEGDQNARLAYAQLALHKGDVDLGLQIVPLDEQRFDLIRSKLQRTRRMRSVIRGTWSLLLVAAIGLSGSLLYKQGELQNAGMNAANLEARAQEARKQADEALREAEQATSFAAREKQSSVMVKQEAEAAKREVAEALLKAEEATRKAMESKRKAEQANIEASAARLEAEKAKQAARLVNEE